MIKANNIKKVYNTGNIETVVLKGIDLHIEAGEFVAIIGPSGAGKSTLMYQLSLLDHPSEGEILIDDKEVTALSSDERTSFRLNSLGYVFQDYALLPELTALENVAVATYTKEGLKFQIVLGPLKFERSKRGGDYTSRKTTVTTI